MQKVNLEPGFMTIFVYLTIKGDTKAFAILAMFICKTEPLKTVLNWFRKSWVLWLQKCTITQEGVVVKADNLNYNLPEMHNCLIFKPHIMKYHYRDGDARQIIEEGTHKVWIQPSWQLTQYGSCNDDVWSLCRPHLQDRRSAKSNQTAWTITQQRCTMHIKSVYKSWQSPGFAQ